MLLEQSTSIGVSPGQEEEEVHREVKGDDVRRASLAGHGDDVHRLWPSEAAEDTTVLLHRLKIRQTHLSATGSDRTQ